MNNLDVLLFMLNFFPDKAYESLFCIFAKKEQFFYELLKSNKINICDGYSITEERREKINAYSKIEEAIGYGADIWKDAEVKRNSAQIINDEKNKKED